MKACWNRRYLLFQKFDQGIKFDEESYISTPPEALTSYIASRFRFQKVLHAYPCIGAYAIKLSNTCDNIIATSVTSKGLECMENNLGIYGV